MANSVVHFEIPADDLDRAHQFYREAFGWDIQHMPEMSYSMVRTSETDDGGMPSQPGAINGGMLKRQSPVESPVVTIAVEDIDATLETVASLGGSTVAAKMPIADMGFAAYFRDSEGNTVGLWQNA